MRVLACGAAVEGHPFPEKVLSRSRGARSKRALGDGSQWASALVGTTVLRAAERDTHPARRPINALDLRWSILTISFMHPIL